MAKILVCDDESGLRTVLKRYAVFEGHEVVEAADGMEAVEACRKESFDIIIMDIFSGKRNQKNIRYSRYYAISKGGGI